MNRRPAPVAALVAAVVALAALPGCRRPDAAPGAARGGGPRAFRVTVQPVEARRIVYVVNAIGSLEALQVVSVPARVSGVLESIAFDVGDTVSRDSVLAVIDGVRFGLEADEIRATITRAEASAASARARTAGAEAALRDARASLDRRRALRDSNPGWVTEEELSSLEAQVARLEAGVAEARAGEVQAAATLEEARARLAVAEKDAADCRVRPPVDGVVERKHVAAGQYVRAGDVLATLVDTSRLRVRFRVTETESVRLVPGLPVTFEVKPFPGRRFEARLFHVDATADAGTRMVECLAEVTSPDPALKPGFFAAVRAEVGSTADAPVVPEASLLPTEKGFVVFAIVDGRASMRPLRLGLHTKDGQVEVLEGIRPGEIIAVDGARALDDGVAVEIVGSPPAGGRDGGPATGRGGAPSPGAGNGGAAPSGGGR